MKQFLSTYKRYAYLLLFLTIIFHPHVSLADTKQSWPITSDGHISGITAGGSFNVLFYLSYPNGSATSCGSGSNSGTDYNLGVGTQLGPFNSCDTTYASSTVTVVYGTVVGGVGVEYDVYVGVLGGSGWRETESLPAGSYFSIVNPENETIAQNSNVTMSASWYITSDDIDRITTLFSNASGKIRVTAEIFDYTSSNWGYNFIDYILPTGFETSTTTTLKFDGTQDPHLIFGHDYKVIWTATGSNYYNFFGPAFSFSTTTYFSVGTTTNSGRIEQVIASSTQATLGTHFASGFSRNACNPTSGDFNVVDCLLSLFIPDTGFYGQSLQNIRTGFLTHQPFGYFTRFVGILNATTTVALPAFTAQIRTGQSTTTDTMTLTYDMQDIVNGAGAVLSNVRDPYFGMNFEDIFRPIIELIVAFAIIIVIFKDLTGSHRHALDPAHHEQQ